jgi:ABC-2 type transport system ATP-binding protein
MTAAQPTPRPSARADAVVGTGAPGSDQPETAALRIAGLSKSFGDTAAVADVDLTVRTGSFLGLVGPNGAGKTTLLSMSIGLLRPDHGTAYVLGRDVWSKAESAEAKQLIGALPDGLALPQRLTGTELLTYLGLLRGMPEDVVRDRAAELLDVLDLAHAGRTLIADYSTGMRKKIGLATALLHGPRVLVLDEPFEAVDPVSAAVVRAILDGFIAAGGTVVMSTHVMALVEQVCDHVAVMAHGKILRTGTLSAVRGGQSLEAAFAELVGAAPARGLSWFAS